MVDKSLLGRVPPSALHFASMEWVVVALERKQKCMESLGPVGREKGHWILVCSK